MYNLTGKRVLVTGGAKGIGYHIAHIFRQFNASVTVIDKIPVIAAYNPHRKDDGIRYVHLDITDTQGVKLFLGGAMPYDILINNAAITAGNDHEEILRVNCNGTRIVTESVLEKMLSRQYGGSIIFITSIHTALAFPDDAAYDASKHWAVGYMRALAVKYAGHGIRVNAVAPGSIASDNIDSKSIHTAQKLMAKIPLGRQGTGREVAEAVLFLASAHAEYITGAELRVDGGASIKNALIE